MESSYHHLTWSDIDLLDKSKAVVALPIGSTEQHGPHLPVDTDTITAMELSRRLSEVVDKVRIIVAPPMRYTYAMPSMVFPGTLSISGETLSRLVGDVVFSLCSQGFTRLLIINAHMENTEFIVEGVRIGLERHPDRRVFLANWWELIPVQELVEIFGPQWGGWVDEHAALVETSLMLCIAPHLVRQDRIENGARRTRFEFRILPFERKFFPPSGIFAPTAGADGAKGEKLMRVAIRELKKIVDEHFS